MSQHRADNLRSVLGFAAAYGIVAAAAANPANYQYSWQEPYGSPAQFFVTGGSTAPSSDPEGDAFLETVLYANGDSYLHFYHVVDVTDMTFSGNASKIKMRAGTNTTVGPNYGQITLPEMDGNPANVNQNDRNIFRARALEAMQSRQLNNYVSTDDNASNYTLILHFDEMVRDNDPNPDEFGELLYFERGNGDGNSWIKMRAVDEDGDPLGPWLVIGPDETVQTTPFATIGTITQTMGTTAIDVSRLGVTEFQHLQISSDTTGEPAYTGGGDQNPDFKLIAVITNNQQLTELGLTND